MSEIDILGLRTDFKFLDNSNNLICNKSRASIKNKNKNLTKVFKTCSRIFHPDKIIDQNSRFEAQEIFQKIHLNCMIFENVLMKVIQK
jgi:hypothetical protein